MNIILLIQNLCIKLISALIIIYYKMAKLYIFALFLISLASCTEIGRRQMFPDQFQNNLNQQQFWFSQILDHYNYQSSATWQQRYYVFDDHFDPATGPILLYICGQAQCRGISSTSWTAKIAQQTKGLVLSLQHRYYGKSLPFGDKSLSLQNLKYLNAGQALRDLAYFIGSISKSGLYKISDKNPWITVGGSYPGAMAAWFRSKYPHLTIGSISSSGVVLAVQDFKMFDQQIYLSTMKSGQYCVQAIVDASKYVESQITGPSSEQFKAQFKAQKLTTQQFLFYWSDAIVFQVQYGNRTHFCNSLKDKSFNEQYEVMKQLVAKVTPVDYGAFYLRDQAFAIADGRGARSWIYQSCTEFSYFQPYSDAHPMRSFLLDLDFYKNWCKQIFGTWPFVSRVNNELGGLDIQASELIMTNGDEDPWKWASLQKSTSKDIYAKVITCDDCAHCVDLRGPTQKDSQDLTSARAYELQSVRTWIKNYRMSKKL